MSFGITPAVAEWYGVCALHDAIRGVADPFLKSHGKLLSDVGRYSERLTDKLFCALRDYLTLASFGEARHALYKSKGIIEDIENSGRVTAYTKAANYDPVKFLPQTIDLFKNYDWIDTAYGGDAWASIAQAALMGWEGKLTKMVWIDHAVDLSHNGGLAFDKEDAGILYFAGYYVNCSKNMYKRLLDYKAHSGSFVDTIRYILQRWGSMRLYTLTMKAHTLGLIHYKPPANPTSSDGTTIDRGKIEAEIKTLLAYSPREWGECGVSAPVPNTKLLFCGEDKDDEDEEDDDDGNYEEGGINGKVMASTPKGQETQATDKCKFYYDIIQVER